MGLEGHVGNAVHVDYASIVGQAGNADQEGHASYVFQVGEVCQRGHGVSKLFLRTIRCPKPRVFEFLNA